MDKFISVPHPVDCILLVCVSTQNKKSHFSFADQQFVCKSDTNTEMIIFQDKMALHIVTNSNRTENIQN